MFKFIIGTFAVLGATFYVLSGGAAFKPEVRQAVAEQAPAPAPEPTPDPAPVAQPTLADVAAATVTLRPVAEVQADSLAEAVETAAAPVFDGSTAGVDGITPAFTSLAAPGPGAPASASLSGLRQVAGRSVNMREGPDTSFAVIDTLPQGTQAEIVEADTTGWVRVRIPATGQTGWIAERLLTP